MRKRERGKLMRSDQQAIDILDRHKERQIKNALEELQVHWIEDEEGGMAVVIKDRRGRTTASAWGLGEGDLTDELKEEIVRVLLKEVLPL